MLGGSYYVAAREEYKSHANNELNCQVILLDGNVEYFCIQKKSSGQCLLDLIFDTLELLERDFFGLQYKDSHPSSGKYYKWLNGAKSIKKQLTGSQPYIFHFRVKFYPNNPNQMKEEYTRYLLFLQLKRDILEEKLHCNQEQTAVLGSYALQAELGDYDPQKHKPGYISEFKFVKNQTPALEVEISDRHTKLKNFSPTKAENEYLNKASQLNYYGVDIFNALTLSKEIVQIGPSSLGFSVFKNKQRLHLFLWSNIIKISFKKKKITIQIKCAPFVNQYKANEESNKVSPVMYSYILSSFPLCKTLWQNCVDYHIFFRVKIPPNNSQIKANTKPKGTNFFGISITPAFGGRRTMPTIEDIQKRSRTMDRAFIRTPTTNRKHFLSRTNSNNHSNMSQNSAVSHSSGTLSSVKLNETKIKIQLLTKYNSFQERSQSHSQNSLDYKPLTATFDSDNSSMDGDEINTYEYRDGFHDSGTFFLSENFLNDRRDKDRTLSNEKTNYRTGSSSPLNYIYHSRSNENKNSKFQIIDKSIDESSNNTPDKLIYSNSSTESLSEMKIDLNKTDSSVSTTKRIPYFTRLSNSVNFHKSKSNISSNGLSKKLNIDRSNSTDRFCDNDLIIKLHCDRNRRYGFTICSTSDKRSPIIINNIGKNTPADTCFPRLHIGDQLISINGEIVDQSTQDEAISMIKKCAETNYGDIVLKIRPSNYMPECNAVESSDWDIPLIESRSDVLSLINSKPDIVSSISDPFKESMKRLEIMVENDDILQQFESVYRKKPGLTMIEAKKTENFAKNRYRDISPYDQTRVILKNSTSSDYINASIINDSLNNSTYASIAKIPKIIPDTALNKEYDNSGSSTIKRQRSISQGDIIRSSKIKCHEQQQMENKIKESHSNSIDNKKRSLNNNQCIFNIPTLNTISLWSLMTSNRDSPYNMFPLIPERTYGQSVVDLVEKLRESEQLNKSMKQSCFLKETGRSFTPPILFNNSYKKSGSFMYSRGRVWTPPSCHMVHGNATTKPGLCSPLKIFDRNSNSYDFNFPDIIGSYRKGNQIFQPYLTPPLSPMDCLNSENDDAGEVIKSILIQDSEKENEFKSMSDLKFNDNNNNDSSAIQAASIYEDLDYESVSAIDNEIEVINDEKILSIKKSDDYLLKPDQIEINGKMKLVEYSDDSINPRTRPISIHLYADDSLAKDKSLKYRFDKCEIFGFSSVQMSPLMEQSIENSSSKTTLSSLSFHQFNRLISSEDSCAKSPPSAELSPSLDNFEISNENSAFLYNDLMWSKLNCAFDDYDTFE